MALSELPSASGREHVKVLCGCFGWYERKAKNGHIILKKDGVAALLSIPDHRNVKRALLAAELKKAGIEDGDYCQAFNRR
jgi:predicted RNA binding protein YcfA (HicA-like mRNA interferase family)